MNIEKLQKFLARVKAANSINFPLIASELGTDWFTEIKPFIEKDAEALRLIQQTIEELKYDLLQNIFKSALNGKMRSGFNLDTTATTAAIKLIDSGALLGAQKTVESEVDEGPSDEEINRHLERLNIKNEEGT